MSQIFDALQRAEAEQHKDSEAQPQGLDLLRQIERRATSRWKSTGTSSKAIAEDPSKGQVAINMQLSEIKSVIPTTSEIEETEFKQQRSVMLNSLPSISGSSSAESRLVCITDKGAPTAEAIRLLGVRLRHIQRSRNLKKVLLTSAVPREGKSIIAANLACVLAYAKEETVLLVEGDLRKPTQMDIFGLQRKPGICEQLQDEHNLIGNIYKITDANVYILPSGESPNNPLDVLQSERLSPFMDKLTAHFDWIIIDSPPILPLADTSIWMKMSDGVILVTRQGITEKEQLVKGMAALDPHKTLGAIVNGITIAASSSYYYYTSPVA